jgi:hypothetical protein
MEEWRTYRALVRRARLQGGRFQALPVARQQLYNYRRNSKVLMKKI